MRNNIALTFPGASSYATPTPQFLRERADDVAVPVTFGNIPVTFQPATSSTAVIGLDRTNEDGIGIYNMSHGTENVAVPVTFHNAPITFGRPDAASAQSEIFIPNPFDRGTADGIGLDDVSRGTENSVNVLFGTQGKDSFEFELGKGHVRIKDFDLNEDTLELPIEYISFLTSPNGSPSQDGDHTVFDFPGDDQLIVENVDANDLLNKLANDLLAGFESGFPF